MSFVLAATHHDPDERLIEQIVRVLPTLRRHVDAIAIHATETTTDAALAPLVQAGAHIRRAPLAGHVLLGRARRGAVAFALELGAEHMLFCDLDRALHWAEFYPDELAQALPTIRTTDFTVIGRTARAFATHPRTQRDTEIIINQVFAQVSGNVWDVTAAARGISRRAAHTLVQECAEESVGTDAAWPLFLQRIGGYSLGYLATEGMEFETLDRLGAELAALGGREAWMQRNEHDVQEWVLRLAIAQAEVAALTPYLQA